MPSWISRRCSLPNNAAIRTHPVLFSYAIAAATLGANKYILKRVRSCPSDIYTGLLDALCCLTLTTPVARWSVRFTTSLYIATMVQFSFVSLMDGNMLFIVIQLLLLLVVIRCVRVRNAKLRDLFFCLYLIHWWDGPPGHSSVCFLNVLLLRKRA